MTPPSFSRLLLVPVALLVLLAFGLAAVLGTVFGERATHYLVRQLVAQAGATVQERLHHHLQEPLRLNQRNVQAFASGEVLAADLFRRPEDWFFPQQTQFPSIDDVYFADAQGAIAGIDKTAGQWVLKLTTDFPQRRFYALDGHGRRWGELATGTYDARTRDWYRLAREAGRPIWSEPYALQNKQAMGTPALGITAAAPVFDRQRQFQGVVGVNITLSTLSGFLREQPVGPDSVSYIIDGRGRLVAASLADMPLTTTGDDGKPQRLPAGQSADARVAASALALGPTTGQQTGLGDALTATIGGQSYWVYVQRDPAAGLDWRVVSVVNPQPFLTGVRTTAQATLVLGVLMLGLLVWLVRRTTRRLAQPLARLAEAVRAVGEGDLGRELPPMHGGREIDELVESFNRMSGALAQARGQLQAHARALEHTIALRTTELSQANRALRTALQRADTANRAKSRFVAELSHGVRTPLHAMLSLTWLLREQPLSDLQRRRLDQIDHAGHHLADIVGGVLELARIESGESPQRPAPADGAEACGAAGPAGVAGVAGVAAARVAAAMAGPQEIAALQVAIAQRHAGQPVLVVEGDPVAAEIAVALLAPTGVQVTVVDSTEQALRHLQQQPCRLLIIDVQFSHPHLDGLALTRALRGQPAHATTPVIALTAVALAEEHQRMHRAGIDHILTKPTSPAEIYTRLLQALN